MRSGRTRNCAETADADHFGLAGPALATALLGWGTRALLTATNRVIDPEIVRLLAMIAFAAFSFVAVLEAKDRWSAETQ